MDLSKDNQKIYSIEAEYYKEYMDEDGHEAMSSKLNSVIKILFVVLLAILAYFAYRIIDGNLVMNEVINKKNIMKTFTSGDAEERYVESLADSEAPVKVDVLSAKREEPLAKVKTVVPKKEVKELVIKEEVIVEKEIKVVVPKKIVVTPTVSKIEVVEHPKVVITQPIKEVTVPVIVESKKETSSPVLQDDLLSDEYLKAMMSEMNK